MSQPSAIEAATRRLAAALDGLEAALERRREADLRQAELAAQLAGFGNDRALLASELDQETARTRRLEQANREVSRRLEGAMETVRDIVGEQERRERD